MRLTDLEQLLQLFRWRDPSVLCDGLVDRFDDRLRQRLDEFLGRLSDPEPLLHSLIVSLLSRLPEERLVPLLRAPHLAGRLVYLGGGDERACGHFLARSLLAELVRDGTIPAVSVPLWSARGDFSAGSDSAPTDYCHLVSGPPTDWGSDLPYPPMDRGGNSLGVMSPAEVLASARIINLALDLLREVSPLAHQFHQRIVQVVSIRLELDNPNQFASGSFRHLPGLSLFTNPHAVGLGDFRVADAMLHEAIHAALYIFESVTGTLTGEYATPERVIQSPWTGSMLNVDSYTQACFVWFGLYWFWRMAGEIAPLAAEAARWRARCLQGFETRSVTTRLSAFRTVVTPEVFDTLFQVESQMEGEL